MSVKVTCGGCGKSYQVDDSSAGKKAKCKACGQVMLVPGERVSSSEKVISSSTPTTNTTARSSSGGVRKISRKPVAADPTDGEFDFSALADVERTGTIDHGYVAPAIEAAPGENKRASSKGTTFAAAKARATPAGRAKQTIAAPQSFAESMMPGVMGYIFLGVIAVGLISLAHQKAAGVMGLVIGGIGLLVCVAAKLQQFSNARAEGFHVYLMYRFVPFYSFYYVCTRWETSSSSVFAWLKGTALILLACILLFRAGGINEALGRKADGSEEFTLKPRKSQPVEPQAVEETEPEFPPNSTLADRVAIRHARRLQAQKEAGGPLDVEPLPFPVRTEFPELGDVQVDSIDRYVIHLDGEFLGEPMVIGLYLPTGAHAPHSLPCIMLPASKEDALEGRTSTQFELNETEVYVKAGFAVMMYDTSRFAINRRPMDPSSCIKEYIQSDGGMHFARNAMNLLAARAVMVDVNRVYAVGHGGSATTALNFAASDPRIKAVATYAPVTDVAADVGLPFGPLEQRLKVAGLETFAHRISPINHVKELRCPVLVMTGGDTVIQEDGDGGNPASGRAAAINAFKKAMNAAGNPMTVLSVNRQTGKDFHYEIVIPKMIEWLKSLPTERRR